MRKLIAMGVVLTLSIGAVMAAEHRGVIKSVEGGKVTFTKFAKKGEKGEDVTLNVASNAKVVKLNFNKDTKKSEAGEALEGGLKNEAVKAGAFAVFVTDADDKNVVELRVGGGRKKKE